MENKECSLILSVESMVRLGNRICWFEVNRTHYLLMQASKNRVEFDLMLTGAALMRGHHFTVHGHEIFLWAGLRRSYAGLYLQSDSLD